MLHADADLSIAVKRPIESHNVRRVALMQHLKLSDDLVSECRFNFKMNKLNRKENVYLEWVLLHDQFDVLLPVWA